MNDAEARAIADGNRKKAAWAEIEPIFASLRDKLSAALFSSGVDQAPLREKLFLAVQTLNSVQRVVEQVVQSGDQAKQVGDHFANIQAAMDAAVAQEGLLRP